MPDVKALGKEQWKSASPTLGDEKTRGCDSKRADAIKKRPSAEVPSSGRVISFPRGGGRSARKTKGE